MEKKAVVFDFDGTVVDSMPFLENVAVELMTENYYISEEEAREKYLVTSGLPFLEQIGNLYPGNGANDFVINTFERRKHEGLFIQPVFPDTEEIMIYLKSRNYMIFISSSSLKESIEEYLRKSNIKKHVDEVMGYRADFQKGRDHFNYIMKKYGLKNNEMIFIGDSLKDFERAKISGVSFIAKLEIFSISDFEELKDEDEELVAVKNLLDLKELL